MESLLIFKFNENSNIKKWVVMDDVVMGGKSLGVFKLNTNGHGVFEGNVSLENNGGFSSVQYKFPKIIIKGSTKAVIKLKGDGKIYQFRIKSNSGDNHSYLASFLTSGTWQQIEIPLKDMYPSFRGKKLEQPNFSNDSIEQIAFLIGNKKAESFKFIIDQIELK